DVDPVDVDLIEARVARLCPRLSTQQQPGAQRQRREPCVDDEPATGDPHWSPPLSSSTEPCLRPAPRYPSCARPLPAASARSQSGASYGPSWDVRTRSGLRNEDCASP